MKINQPQWVKNKELPPVGTFCKVHHQPGKWCECEVVAHRDGRCICWSTDLGKSVFSKDPSAFKPIADVRSKVIEDMSRIIHDNGGVINDVSLGALYELGYRKF